MIDGTTVFGIAGLVSLLVREVILVRADRKCREV